MTSRLLPFLRFFNFIDEQKKNFNFNRISIAGSYSTIINSIGNEQRWAFTYFTFFTFLRKTGNLLVINLLVIYM
jgi:hypothetical protein